MKKTLSFILSILMILSVCSFSISAAEEEIEAIPVNTEEEFYEMDFYGNYYLNADITLTKTRANYFAGVLDGNGHTLTVSNPVFNYLNGTVKNLIIEGNIEYKNSNAAALAIQSNRGFTAENVINNANVSVTGRENWAAGFVTRVLNGKTVVFKNCVNNGDISAESDNKPRAAGFAAIIDSARFLDCKNNGTIYSKGYCSISAGFIARGLFYLKGNYVMDFYGCVNNGNVTAEDTYINPSNGNPGAGGAEAGGFVGYSGGSGYSAVHKFYGCVNNGDISGGYRVGGLVGYIYGSNICYPDVQKCINTGDIVYGRTYTKGTTTDYGSAFVGYVNSIKTTIKNNLDIGTVAIRSGASTKNKDTAFIGCGKKDSTGNIYSNYILNREQYKLLSYSTTAANVHEFSANTGVYDTNAEELKSGKIAVELNKGGSAVSSSYKFYQKLGTDAAPSLDMTRGEVFVHLGRFYYNTEDQLNPGMSTDCKLGEHDWSAWKTYLVENGNITKRRICACGKVEYRHTPKSVSAN